MKGKLSKKVWIMRFENSAKMMLKQMVNMHMDFYVEQYLMNINPE